MVPGDSLEKTERNHYIADVNRLLNTVKGAYTSAWFIDHLQFQDSDVLEGWTALTYLAAQHPELQWGHAVLCQSFRNPALVAKMAATLQFISGGRFILGIGAGWHTEEYLAYGYDFPAASTRVEELDEALQIIRALWTENDATFVGKHHQIRNAWCEPKPDPVPPIMVGHLSPKCYGWQPNTPTGGMCRRPELQLTVATCRNLSGLAKKSDATRRRCGAHGVAAALVHRPKGKLHRLHKHDLNSSPARTLSAPLSRSWSRCSPSSNWVSTTSYLTAVASPT